ncbi:hypothetical protein CYLTODRAFT_14661 [Cylindrobasidium torrendii FP15055 ss-10]|uniref:Uncharacterized protein n=1 Tax=Cylindrobasidium torrendii FP15055 ss-10 TaxID=1314674 RepID=A0A0D7B960_9AGAR|nr:hypothetical protein CYLTODRAFT_14661 [Cylindrobasidium torrendii FP15055 ss-10]
MAAQMCEPMRSAIQDTVRDRNWVTHRRTAVTRNKPPLQVVITNASPQAPPSNPTAVTSTRMVQFRFKNTVAQDYAHTACPKPAVVSQPHTSLVTLGNSNNGVPKFEGRSARGSDETVPKCNVPLRGELLECDDEGPSLEGDLQIRLLDVKAEACNDALPQPHQLDAANSSALQATILNLEKRATDAEAKSLGLQEELDNAKTKLSLRDVLYNELRAELTQKDIEYRSLEALLESTEGVVSRLDQEACDLRDEKAAYEAKYGEDSPPDPVKLEQLETKVRRIDLAHSKHREVIGKRKNRLAGMLAKLQTEVMGNFLLPENYQPTETNDQMQVVRGDFSPALKKRLRDPDEGEERPVRRLRID